MGKKSTKRAEVAQLVSIMVKTSSGDMVDIRSNELSSVPRNGEHCFYYKSDDGDLIIPLGIGEGG